jgi:CsoR family transcriptional regulator, copper-sensing transcriptional repressor
MKSKTRDAAHKRLARIEGQVRGVSRMIGEEQYCIDVVRQIQAIKAALAGVEKTILDDHLETCVQKALHGENFAERRDKVQELVAVLGGRKK